MNCIQYHLLNGDKFPAVSPLHQVKNLFLRLLQHLVQRFHAAVAEVADLVIGPDQSAQSRFLGHNIGVFLNIGGAKIRIQDITHKFHAADLLRNLLCPQMILQRYQINGLITVKQLYHGFKDHAVLSLIKILPCNNLRGNENGFPIHNHGADNGALRLLTVGHRSFNNCFFHLMLLLHLP